MTTENQWLGEKFEANREHLQAVAYRMLGSLSEANDAVQESWLRLSRADANEIENLGGWLATVVARVCLDMLRSRSARHEESLDEDESLPERLPTRGTGIDPEQEALLADSVGLALLVVLDTLNPAERLAFVLHDIFGMPFEEIAPIAQRSGTAVRQLASRARRRVQGAVAAKDADLASQREVVHAFLTASREGSFEALLAVLDPDVVFRADAVAAAIGSTLEMYGAQAVAQRFMGRARGAQIALLDGAIGVLVAPQGQILLILNLTIAQGKITGIEAVGEPERLRHVRIATVED